MVPFPGLSSAETVNAIKQGYQMEKPDNCPDEIYQIMKECLNLDADKRPVFTDVCKRINTIYRNIVDPVDEVSESKNSSHNEYMYTRKLDSYQEVNTDNYQYQ